MAFPLEIILIASSLGAVQSGFFSIYFLFASKKSEVNKLLLGLLFLALSIRMFKSVGYYFSNDNLPNAFENLGYAAHLAIAPTLFLYLKSFLEKDFVFKRIFWLHFFPTVLALVALPFLSDTFWLGAPSGYLLSLVYFGAYFPFIYFLIYKSVGEKRNRPPVKEIVWIFLLTFGIQTVWAAYAANFLLGMVSYITAPLALSFVIYPISFFILIHHKMFFNAHRENKERYKNSKLTDRQIEEYAKKIENFLAEGKHFRDSNLTLPQLEKKLLISRHIVSEVINRHFEMSFAEFINSYRLEDAKKELKNIENLDKKIAAIAHDCGFGTVSTFNTFFKKNTDMTPSEYRQKHL